MFHNKLEEYFLDKDVKSDNESDVDLYNSEEEKDTLDILLNKFDQTENQSNNEDFDIEINDVKVTDFTPCVLIDKINGTIQRCNSIVGLRSIRQLVGFWEIDRRAFNEKRNGQNWVYVIRIFFMTKIICNIPVVKNKV